MKNCRLYLFILSVMVLAGCTPNSNDIDTVEIKGPEPVGSVAAAAEQEYTVNFVDTLLEKSNRIGASEFARFNASEMLYKNTPQLYSTTVPIMEIQRFFWVKTYRRYTGYEVTDIKRSSSLLKPFSYEITYDFDQFSTSARNIENREGALRQSSGDSNFSMLFHKSFVRNYLCDSEGNLLGATPDLPPRWDGSEYIYGNAEDNQLSAH